MRPIFENAAMAIFICFTCTVSYAEEIIWDQPQGGYQEAPVYHQNLNFEGNATMRYSDVLKMQKALAAKGFYKGRIDGIWGGRTTQAILDYQAVNQQPLTGTMTIETMRDLGVYIDEHNYR